MANYRPKELRQSPRLAGFDYTQAYVYNICAVTRARAPLFSDPMTATESIEAMNRARTKLGFDCYAYCFMPDHVHLLVANQSGGSVEELARLFKQLAGFAYKKRTGQQLWQISYFDHILRVEEAIRPVAEYIWNNQIRAGLVERPKDWPYLGPLENIPL